MLCASRHPRQAVCAGDGASRHRPAARPSCSSAPPARSVLDLSWHLPSGIVDRRASPPIRRARAGRIATLTVRVDAHQPGFGRRPYRVLCTDDTGDADLVYFNVKGDQLARLLPVGAERVVSGRVEFYGSMPQMAHPDLVAAARRARPLQADRAGLSADRGARAARRAEGGRGGARPRPGTAGMDRPGIARAARLAGLARGASARRMRPKSEDDLSPTTPARERLAYDEILASQLAVALVARAGAAGRRAGDRRHRRLGRRGRGGASASR